MASIYIRGEDGDTLEAVVQLASAVATASKRTLQFTFNGFPVVVGPNHSSEAVIRDYVKRATTYKEDD